MVPNCYVTALTAARHWVSQSSQMHYLRRGMLLSKGDVKETDETGSPIMTATNVNWVKVEKAYRAGILPVSQIAKQCGLSSTAIHKRAKKQGWERDLTARVRAKTAEKLFGHG